MKTLNNLMGDRFTRAGLSRVGLPVLLSLSVLILVLFVIGAMAQGPAPADMVSGIPIETPKAFDVDQAAFPISFEKRAGQQVTILVDDYSARLTEMVSLVTDHSKYVSAMGGDDNWLLKQEAGIGDCERFTLLHLEGDQVALKSCHGRYVTAPTTGTTILEWTLRQEESLTDCAKFTLHYSDSGKVAFETCAGRYFTAGNDSWQWAVTGSGEQVQAWEEFRLYTGHWPHNRLEGDRGPIGKPAEIEWGARAVTATIATGQSTVGVWSSLNHPVTDCEPLDFSAIFPSQIISQYQGSITGLQVHILTGTEGTAFQVQLQIGEPVACPPQIPVYTRTETLTGGEQYISFTFPPTLTKVQNLNWQIIGADGDFVVVDRVELTATVPQLEPERQAFLWSYAQLLGNWNPATGLTRDTARHRTGAFDNVSASGLQAAAAVMAAQLGFISEASATEIVSKITQALLALPRDESCGSGGSRLWPHFARDGQIVAGTEWSSIDTVIAAVALIEARQALGLAVTETISVEQVLRDINWDALISTDTGYISHGYWSPDCNPIEAPWTDFGLESWIVGLGYVAATDTVPRFDHIPPTANGGGFIDELAWLLMPLVCRDRWGTEWCDYSQQAVEHQLAYYDCDQAQARGCCGADYTCQAPGAEENCLCCQDHPYYKDHWLFGLTPNEIPDLSRLPSPTMRWFLDFGICGKSSCIDGVDPVTLTNPVTPGGPSITHIVSLGHAVIVPHYAGIVASLRPTRAISVWNWLEEKGLVTPLNNAESLMCMDETTCDQITWNARKGAWELGLQTLGWGRYLVGNDNPLYRGFQANDALMRGYDAMRYPAPTRAAFKTCYDRYVTAMGAENGWVLSQTVELTECSKFTLIHLNDGKVALVTCYGKYVTAEGEAKGWIVRAETTEIQDWEEFTPTYTDDDRMAFKTYHYRHLTAMGAENGWVLSQTVELTDCGKFTMVSLPEVSKQANPDPVQAGEQLTYTITVTNTGDMTLTATITDVLPDHVAPNATRVWTATIPAPGGVWTQQFTVTTTWGYSGTLTNLVQVTAEEGAVGEGRATVNVVCCRVYLPLILRGFAAR